MVESETFVSHRRKPAGRRAPRKLFTAKGLVGGDEGTRDGDASKQSFSEDRKNNESSTVDTCPLDKSSDFTRIENFNYSHDYDDSSNLQSHYNGDVDNSSFHEGSISNDLEEVLQMGCMDGFFFSAPIRNRTTKHDSRCKEVLRLPSIKVNPTTFPRHRNSAYFGNIKVESPFPRGLNCHLPYHSNYVMDDHVSTNFFDRHLSVSDDKGNAGYHGPFIFSKNTEPRVRDEGSLPGSNQISLSFSSMSIEAPPSQIYIGLEPQFSEDLIPVDDLPPPGIKCNLTKYHPRPLSGRLNFAFGKPMLSIDSEESDASEQGHFRTNDQDFRHPQLTQQDQKGQAHVTKGMLGTSKLDDTCIICPSFDDAGPSFDNNETTTATIVNKDANHTGRNEVVAIETFDAHQLPRASCNSADSVATDNAISNEKPAKKKVHASTNDPSHAQGTSCALQSENPTALEQLVRFSSATTESVQQRESNSAHSATSGDDVDSCSTVQDENNTPARTPSTCCPKQIITTDKMSENCLPLTPRNALALVPSPTYRLNSPHLISNARTEIKRKSIGLMIGTNSPASPRAHDDDEFFSPKATTPMQRNNLRGGQVHRFAFDDSFDDAEFFDTYMA